jgi:hypothetical protein
MPGERKKLDSLITSPPPAPPASPASPLSRPDRSDKPDRSAGAEPPEVPARSAAAGDMTMRSWYMPKASADRLAALVDDVHFATRLPKHLIMGALVNVVDRHRDEVEAEARSAAGE